MFTVAAFHGSNRTITYFNTAVKNVDNALIKQSALKHNLVLNSIILNTIYRLCLLAFLKSIICCF